MLLEGRVKRSSVDLCALGDGLSLRFCAGGGNLVASEEVLDVDRDLLRGGEAAREHMIGQLEPGGGAGDEPRVALDNIALAVNEELLKVPLDTWRYHAESLSAIRPLYGSCEARDSRDMPIKPLFFALSHL